MKSLKVLLVDYLSVCCFCAAGGRWLPVNSAKIGEPVAVLVSSLVCALAGDKSCFQTLQGIQLRELPNESMISAVDCGCYLRVCWLCLCLVLLLLHSSQVWNHSSDSWRHRSKGVVFVDSLRLISVLCSNLSVSSFASIGDPSIGLMSPSVS